MDPEQPDAIDRAMQRWSELGYAADVDVMEASLRLASIHARAAPRVEATHRQQGLVAGDFDVLATIYRSGDNAVTPGSLARQLLYSKSGTTGRLDRLQRAGLLLRRPSDADRRGMTLALTPRGRQVVEELLPAHVAAERALVRVLTPTELRSLNRLLGKVMRDIDED